MERLSRRQWPTDPEAGVLQGGIVVGQNRPHYPSRNPLEIMTEQPYRFSTATEITAEHPQVNNIIFSDQTTEEVIRFDKKGFYYKNQFIPDAGEAYRLMLEFLKMNINPTQRDEHYEWELQDSKEEWAAGGSANDFEAVHQEGLRYLTMYSESEHHKLIIRHHQTTTLFETEMNSPLNDTK
jgi:hypothetical protein